MSDDPRDRPSVDPSTSFTDRDPELGKVLVAGSPSDSDDSINNVQAHDAQADELPPVDGIRAWAVVLGAFIALFISLGSLYGFGIWIASYRAVYPTVGSGEIALVGTIGLGLFFACGLVSGPLSDKYGPRIVMTIGTIFWTAGYALAGASTEFWQTMLTHGILVGIGSSLCYWPAITTVPMWFKKYSATGTAIAALGSGLGNLFFALAGNTIIDSLGYRNTLFLIAGLGCFLMMCSVALIVRRVPPMKKGRLFDAARALLPLWNYRLMLLITFFFQFAFFVPFVHISPYCVDQGYTTGDGALALAMLGVGSTVGRIVFGPFADKVGKMTTLRLCVIAGGISMAVWPSLHTLDAILAFAFLYGAFGGGFIALSPTVSAELFGANRLGGVFALMNLAMVPGAFASSPLAGLARDATGGYGAAVYPASALLIIAGLLFYLVRMDQAVGNGTPEAKTVAQQDADKNAQDIEEQAGNVDPRLKEEQKV